MLFFREDTTTKTTTKISSPLLQQQRQTQKNVFDFAVNRDLLQVSDNTKYINLASSYKSKIIKTMDIINQQLNIVEMFDRDLQSNNVDEQRNLEYFRALDDLSVYEFNFLDSFLKSHEK